MSEQTPARPGDTVMIHIKAVVTHLDDHDNVVMAQVDGERDSTYIPRAASVEVLERADDPAKDLVGTVRQSPAGVIVAKQWGAIGWAVIWDCGATDYDHYLDEDVAGWPVIGSVPGTPAAEAGKPSGHCASCECLHDECGYVIGSAACEESHVPDPEVSGAGVPFPADATPLPKPRDLCALDDCPAAPRCSSGAAVWHDRTSECRPSKREPRVFQSDGPEPPEDVTCVEWINHDLNAFRYLKRAGLGNWAWAAKPDAAVKPDYPGGPWPVLKAGARREFREVV